MTVMAMDARAGAARMGTLRTTDFSPIGLPVPVDCRAGQAAPGAGHARMELTRRGRFVFFGLPALVAAALVLLAMCALAAGSLASPAQASASHEPIDMADYAVSVTVLQGESLWSIAGAADPNRDVREVVSEIVALNDLGSGIVQAGQRLYVPIPR